LEILKIKELQSEIKLKNRRISFISSAKIVRCIFPRNTKIEFLLLGEGERPMERKTEERTQLQEKEEIVAVHSL
jgi:hypothetical protein